MVIWRFRRRTRKVITTIGPGTRTGRKKIIEFFFLKNILNLKYLVSSIAFAAANWPATRVLTGRCVGCSKNSIFFPRSFSAVRNVANDTTSAGRHGQNAFGIFRTVGSGRSPPAASTESLIDSKRFFPQGFKKITVLRTYRKSIARTNTDNICKK